MTRREGSRHWHRPRPLCAGVRMFLPFAQRFSAHDAGSHQSVMHVDPDFLHTTVLPQHAPWSPRADAGWWRRSAPSPGIAGIAGLGCGGSVCTGVEGGAGRPAWMTEHPVPVCGPSLAGTVSVAHFRPTAHVTLSLAAVSCSARMQRPVRPAQRPERPTLPSPSTPTCPAQTPQFRTANRSRP